MIIDWLGKYHFDDAVSFTNPGFAPGGASYSIVLADSITLADNTVKAPSKALGDTLHLTDGLGKSPSKGLSDSVHLSDQVSATRGYSLQLADSIHFTELMASEKYAALVKVLSDSITLSDNRAAASFRSLSDTMSLSDSQAPAFSRRLDLADSLALSDYVELLYTAGVPNISVGGLKIIKAYFGDRPVIAAYKGTQKL